MRALTSYMARWHWFVVGVFFAICNFAHAVTNDWTKTSDGFWQEPFWSLGVLPDSTQSVSVTNGGVKTLEINATTAANFPGALSIVTLEIGGTNTLSLNHVPTNVPLQIAGGFLVRNGAAVQNLQSAVEVQNGAMWLNNAQMFQDGGSLRVVNGSMFLYNDSTYSFTNGLFEAYLDLIDNCVVSQVGGIANLPTFKMEGGSYHLVSGRLVSGTQWGSASVFTQDDGTNTTGSLALQPPPQGFSKSGQYFMNGGLLGAGDIQIGPEGGFYQNAGVCIVTNTALIQGSARYFPPQPIAARYDLTSGTLIARNLVVDDSGGFSYFSSAGTVSVAQDIRLVNTSAYVDVVSSFGIGGGTLTCSNFLNEGGAIDVSQTGGNVVVSNSLVFGGYYAGTYNGYGARFAQYALNGGTLTASNITLTATMTIGSSAQSGRITNSGMFQMAGTLVSGDANEQLGRFILLSNAVIDFGAGAAALKFADSSAESWSAGALLTLSNWNGSLSGGGSDQLRFGAHASGLSPAQVAQIKFIDPTGLPAGTYPARILNSGEIVPAVITIGRNNKTIVIGWGGNLSLETSTNVAGPYTPVSGATSPYTNTFVDDLRFFRVR